ncbi:MAG TPA: glycosyltransferase [Terracidiphilus sp.]|nr:glycosyltransferase [Terracidiphilus sp.]
MNSDLRIFLACASYSVSYGGPAVTVPQLAASLCCARVDVGLWSPDGTADTSAILERSLRIERLHGNLSEAISTFGRVDLIHDNGIWLPHNHLLAGLAAEREIPRLVSTRGMLEPWAFGHKGWKKRLAWWAYQKGDLAQANCLHTTSETESENLRRFELDVPIAHVANGVEVPSYSELAMSRAIAPRKGKRIALFLGRLYPIKGLPLLVEAWARVRPRGWSLVIAGPNEAGHRSEIERVVRRQGLTDQVSFPGPVAPRDRLSVYANADLFILPSYSESFGMAAGEALACGLPVITTTGTPWLQLAARGCGWRVAPTLEGLEGALREATSSDAASLVEMGAKGREFVTAEFGWSAVAKRMIGLYRTIITGEANLHPAVAEG